ncbi:shikimate kinase [Capnocytophaga catalasegens]|uniref:Shikimate kinase n=1 Tax=Capnocytophaga catalasegens TaxID=1004260 RepID=A0AAV5AYN1_9FLAO|nr:shikimate kinase [Capnocytophaga catalasegens]GIZ15417.1 shikimate kinase [Capnocytophaga catalasegens]GJM51005.1 shikimate kinase [Capnocytophaga catalasegens]GJM52190.1 shikimate kinase [Capnocytophaga catalasegens]
MSKKIILIGYMGSGKSVIGKFLAQKINLPFIDLDLFIEEKEQKTISEIFKLNGEIYFRKIETMYLNQLLDSKKDFVLSVGGGTPCFGTNIQQINKASEFVFYLQLNAQSLTKRLTTQKGKRPLLTGLQDDKILEDFINKHLFDRNPYYRQAHIILPSDGLSITEIVNKIITFLPSDLFKKKNVIE